MGFTLEPFKLLLVQGKPKSSSTALRGNVWQVIYASFCHPVRRTWQWAGMETAAANGELTSYTESNKQRANWSALSQLKPTLCDILPPPRPHLVSLPNCTTN